MIHKKIKDMDLEQIAGSGQCFRMEKLEDGAYSLIAFDRYLEIRQQGEDFQFLCTEEEFSDIWEEYLDLKRDYGQIKNSADTEDTYLQSAIQAGHGIRILKQDLWEMIVTFLVSQNNNISRIKKSITLLCETLGEKHSAPNGAIYYSFPQPENIMLGGMEKLSTLGLGYRDKYILKTAESVLEGRLNLAALKEMDYQTAHQELMNQYGIGKKVADCICLFGLHHVDAFPIDTHVKKILEAHYPQGFPYEKYHSYAGILQQYMFYYDLQS